ncbi:hypothetical protein Hanom_Chr02g00146811 [Helianthus anomalus]
MSMLDSDTSSQAGSDHKNFKETTRHREFFDLHHFIPILSSCCIFYVHVYIYMLIFLDLLCLKGEV